MPSIVCEKTPINLKSETLIRLAVIEAEPIKTRHKCTAFHIMLEDESNHFSLIRYIQDFKDLDKLFYHHFRKHYVPLPKLKERRSIKSFFLFFTKKKTNASLLEKYLTQCLSSKLSNTSLFRDFLSIQRPQDRVIPKPSVAQTVKQNELKRKRHCLSSSCSHQQKKMAPNHPENNSDAKRQDDGKPICETIQNHQLIKVLGQGSTGKVMLVRKSEQLYALKTMIKAKCLTQREVGYIRHERDILSSLSPHPFLIRFHRAFQDAQNLYLVMGYHAGADLATLLQRYTRFPADQCRLYAAELTLGLQELHRQSILYRDLKPENVLIASDGHLVLTDFGLSKRFDSHQQHHAMTFCGTPEYLAPEIILHEHEYSYPADFWSLGTMLYEMITGVTPFAADTLEDMYERVLYDDLSFPPGFSPTASDLIKGLLTRDPSTRLGAFELRKHPYFDLNWNDVLEKRIQPAFVPTLQDETDLTHFDPECLDMPTDIGKPEQIWHTQPAGLKKHAFDGYSFIK